MRVRGIQGVSIAVLPRLAVIGTALGLAAASAAVAAPHATASSTARRIPIVGWLNPGEPVVAPDGDLWLTAQRAVSSSRLRTELLKITATGKVVRVVDRDVTPVLIGPDGDLWFATTGAEVRLGSISADGRIRVFSPFPGLQKASTDPEVDLDGAAVGPNGDVWFAVDSDYEGHSEVGYITPTGHITTERGLTDGGFGWFGIATDTNGYVWLTGLNQLTWISPDGATGTLRGISAAGALVPDLAGDAWAPSGQAAEFYEVRSGASGHPRGVRTVTWTGAGEVVRYAPPVAVATAADGGTWFLSAPCTGVSALALCNGYGDPVLGSISSTGVITTDPVPIPSQAALTPQLTAGPDGQLLSSVPTDQTVINGAYQPTNNGALWAITLPDAPQTRSPSLRLLNAVQYTHRTVLTLHCTGQTGRYCSGTITLRAANSAPQVQRYAIDPDHTTTYQIAMHAKRRGTQASLTVTNAAPNGRIIQKLSRTTHVVG